MKLHQDIHGNRELSETYIPSDTAIELKSDSSINSAFFVGEEYLTYLNVTGWNESKQKWIRIYGVSSITGEEMQKDDDEKLEAFPNVTKALQSIQVCVRFLTEDLKEEVWGYIESFTITSTKDKCIISFSRYDDEERDKEINAKNNIPGILNISKAVCVKTLSESNPRVVLNFYK